MKLQRLLKNSMPKNVFQWGWALFFLGSELLVQNSITIYLQHMPLPFILALRLLVLGLGIMFLGLIPIFP